MSLRNRLRTGLTLAGQSACVLRRNPVLVVYPTAGGIATLGFGATALVGLVAVGDTASVPVVVALLFCVYVGTSFLTAFSIAALSWATREVFAGRDPSVSAAFRAALGHTPALFWWALVSAVIGLVLRAIEESSDVAGTILSGLLSLGWVALTYFVVPVIVFEDAGPTTMFQQSGQLVRETWGESLGSEFGVGLVTILLVLPGVFVSGLVFVAVPGEGALVATVVVGGLVLATGALAGYTLGAVAKVALYSFARDSQVPSEFDESVLRP